MTKSAAAVTTPGDRADRRSTAGPRDLGPRLIAVDVLRGVAIASVVYLHITGYFGFVPTFVIPEALSAQLTTNGYYGVSIFFVISGFLITRYVIARDERSGR